MDEKRREKLIECIRKDDKVAFGEFMTPEVLSAIFGRFPVLSLLYLYNARSIVKRYLPELIKERPRVKEEPFREADRLFAAKAGKCLRYYIDAEVSPLEMLAVLGRGREIEKLYPIYPNSSRVLPMIHKIYFTRLGAGVVVTGDKLRVPVEPLSFALKKALVRFALICLISFAVITAVTSFVFVYYGVGSSASYFHARTAEDAIEALNEDKYIKLESDLTLSAGTTSYAATMEGGGHILYLDRPFAELLTGEIHDVIFVVKQGFIGDAVILRNEGVLDNVRVVAEDITLQKGGEYMGLLTAVNAGTIKGCTAVMGVSISGEGGGDCFFAPFAGSNEGLIHDCTADGVVTAINVDVAGVAGKNGAGGTITDCVVKSELSESANIKNWTPNVAGVSAQNQGAIYGCAVTGKVTSLLRAPAVAEDESAASAYAAGVACVNGGSIRASNVDVACLADAENGYAFAGGTVVFNFDQVSQESILPGTIQTSSASGSVSAHSSTHDAYCAGVAAINYYKIESCRSSAAVSATAETGYAFAAGVTARNTYVSIDLFTQYTGEVTTCLSSGDVSATSAAMNAYAGGIAAENNQGVITSCGHTAVVTASTAGGTVYGFIGGVVGYNYGTVDRCFFLGTLCEYDEDTFVGGICGLLRLPFAMGHTMEGSYFSSGAHANGATLFGMNYYSLRAGYIYSLAFFENNEGYEGYIEGILDFGGTAASAEDIKASEVYYE